MGRWTGRRGKGRGEEQSQVKRQGLKGGGVERLPVRLSYFLWFVLRPLPFSTDLSYALFPTLPTPWSVLRPALCYTSPLHSHALSHALSLLYLLPTCACSMPFWFMICTSWHFLLQLVCLTPSPPPSPCLPNALSWFALTADLYESRRVS